MDLKILMVIFTDKNEAGGCCGGRQGNEGLSEGATGIPQSVHGSPILQNDLSSLHDITGGI